MSRNRQGYRGSINYHCIGCDGKNKKKIGDGNGKRHGASALATKGRGSG